MESTRLTLRLPAPLASEAAALADAMGISLNAFLTLGVRNWVVYQKRGMQAAPPPPRPPLEAPSQQVASSKVGRNDPCPCGSGRKFKLCHGRL